MLRTIGAAAVFTLLAAGIGAASQSSETAVVAAVKQALSGQDDLRRLMVSASGTEVTLSGRLPSLWLKRDAIRRTLKVNGVETVASNIELPRLESDVNLAVNIGRAIDRYPYYTIFDYIDAVIRKGAVTLTGSVTSGTRNKDEEIEEEVAKVRGVQDIENKIETLPPSQADDQIRAAIYDRIQSSIHFDQIVAARVPPIRIVVKNSSVTLYGTVQSEVELRELESIARFTSGVLRVENNLRTVTQSRR
jgi:osmotically-inducible protein OsmY